jgi:Leucine rich repeat
MKFVNLKCNYKLFQSFELYRKIAILLLIVNVFSFIENIEARKISCEIVVKSNWSNSTLGKTRTCFMRNTTVIDGKNVIISPRDESVLGLSFNQNKKINFLPDGVTKVFPNLIGYTALNCSIQEISIRNFAGLNKLKVLALSFNQIATINTDTFEDLISLEFINLGKKI